MRSFAHEFQRIYSNRPIELNRRIEPNREKSLKRRLNIIYIFIYIYIYILISRRRRPNPVDGYLLFVLSNSIRNHLLFWQMLADLGRSFALI